MIQNVKQVGLKINEQKTKYLKMTGKQRQRFIKEFTCGDLTFEGVHDFVYLGSSVNDSNNVSYEIERRIISGNKAYYANLNLLKSQILSRKSKTKIYKTIIRPVVTYGSETWTMNGQDEERLRVFERKILRKILGPIQENGEWRIRRNKEIEDYIDGEDIVRFIKSGRIRWAGHIQRMNEDRIPKQVFRSRMEGRRIQGRPRNRWQDQLERDLKNIGVRKWKETAQDRKKWKGVVLEAKAHKEL